MFDVKEFVEQVILPMWNMYGNNANGCCVVFDSSTFFSRRDKEFISPFYRVGYISSDGSDV